MIPVEKPLRVALVSDSFLPRVGGIEIHLQGLAEGLMRAGHEPHIITVTPGNCRDYAFPVHRLDVPVATRFGFVYTMTPFDKMAALLRSRVFDVVHCHGSILSPLSFGSAYLAQKLGFPTLITFHSIIKYYYWLFLMANRLIGWSRWSVLFTAVSPTAARFLKKAGCADPVEVLPNAVDESFWRLPSLPQKDPSTCLLVSVMRLSIRKRAHVLIAMLPEIMRRIPPNQRLRLVIVGEGAQKAHLEKLIRRLDLTEVVELPGLQNREQIADLLCRADFFVLPAKQEAFGIAALEARAAGLPVLGMGQSGLQHLIRHGEEGLLASSDRELMEHIVTLINDSDLRRNISRHNRTTSISWTWPSAIARHLELYGIVRKRWGCHDGERKGLLFKGPE